MRRNATIQYAAVAGFLFGVACLVFLTATTLYDAVIGAAVTVCGLISGSFAILADDENRRGW